MKLERKMESEESKKRWEFIDKAAKEVKLWPNWKKAEAYPNFNYKSKSRFEDLPKSWQFCKSPNHNPPMHLFVPPNKIYVHVCSECGLETRIMNNQGTL